MASFAAGWAGVAVTGVAAVALGWAGEKFISKNAGDGLMIGGLVAAGGKLIAHPHVQSAVVGVIG